MKILTNYDFSKNQIMNVGLQQLGSHPASPVDGQIYFNTTDKRAYIYDGTNWKGSDALDAVMTAAKIVQTINDSSETIVDLRLSSAAQSAIAKAHDIQTIATIPGLQAALDDKVDNSRVQTDVPTEAIFTDTKYTNGLGLNLTGEEFSVKFGTTVNTVPHGNDARFSDSRTPKSHTHGNISDDGKIGTVAGLMVKTGTAGALDTMPVGTAGQFLSHNGTWATPPNQIYSVFGKDTNGLVPKPGTVATNSFLRSDGVWIPQEETAYNLPIATTTVLGGVKASPSISVHTTTGAATVVDNSHKHTMANVTGLDAALAAKETPAGAQAKADTAKGLAATYTDEQIAILVGTAPTTLDTLHEIARALGDDPNFATTITNLIGSKTGKFTKVLTAATTQVVTHNLGTRDVAVTIRESAAPYAQVITDVEFTSTDTLTVGFARAPLDGEYTITVIG